MILIEELKKGGCRVEFVERPMSSEPNDQLLLQIRGAVAEYERTLLSERMRRGRLAKYKAGLLLPWTHVPYALRVDLDRLRDPAGVSFEEAKAAVVSEIFAAYLEPRASLFGVSRHLREMGVPASVRNCKNTRDHVPHPADPEWPRPDSAGESLGKRTEPCSPPWNSSLVAGDEVSGSSPLVGSLFLCPSAEPYLTHVPTLTGGTGYEEVRRFYKYHFIPGWPPDVEVTLISRTVGQGRVVDELIVGFTHDREMDAILPGIKPTGRWVELPHAVVVGLEDGKVAYEHIYWDQGSALYQLGLLSEGLPVIGAEAAQRLRDSGSISANRLMARWAESEGKD
jgi:carboxymethylenebutenolidase